MHLAIKERQIAGNHVTKQNIQKENILFHISSSLGDKGSASSDMSHISSASFGIQII
jgi:hypothetical protein